MPFRRYLPTMLKFSFSFWFRPGFKCSGSNTISVRCHWRAKSRASSFARGFGPTTCLAWDRGVLPCLCWHLTLHDLWSLDSSCFILWNVQDYDDQVILHLPLSLFRFLSPNSAMWGFPRWLLFLIMKDINYSSVTPCTYLYKTIHV